MSAPKSKKAVIHRFEAAPANVQAYFCHLPRLVADYPLDVPLSYLFAQVELAHNTALYCGVVKLHRANSVVARSVIDTHHMTRSGFKDRFEIVFGTQIPDVTSKKLTRAEDVRDRVMHGKYTTEKARREAIVDVLEYAEEFNKFVSGIASFQPFGDLRGFKGRAQSLNASTTRWVLKGMGFAIA